MIEGGVKWIPWASHGMTTERPRDDVIGSDVPELADLFDVAE